jgi:hypothetical protein
VFQIFGDLATLSKVFFTMLLPSASSDPCKVAGGSDACTNPILEFLEHPHQ